MKDLGERRRIQFHCEFGRLLFSPIIDRIRFTIPKTEFDCQVTTYIALRAANTGTKSEEAAY